MNWVKRLGVLVNIKTSTKLDDGRSLVVDGGGPGHLLWMEEGRLPNRAVGVKQRGRRK